MTRNATIVAAGQLVGRAMQRTHLTALTKLRREPKAHFRPRRGIAPIRRRPSLPWQVKQPQITVAKLTMAMQQPITKKLARRIATLQFALELKATMKARLPTRTPLLSTPPQPQCTVVWRRRLP